MLQALSLSFLISSLMFSALWDSTTNSNIYVQCSQLNFTYMTPYESNVNSLFISLVESSSVCNFNTIETSPLSDIVYGLFQCRGDLSSPNCKDCVANAITQLKTTCPISTGGEIQLEGCFVKYDETSYFGVDDKMEAYRRCGPSIGYNYDILNSIDGALAYLVDENGQYFRQGDFGSVQGVAQCVQDLSLSDCQDCLLEARGRLRSECESSTWGDMYLGKCYIRYVDHGKENLANNCNDSSCRSKTNSSSKESSDIMKWIGYIIAGFAALLGLGGCTFAVNNYFTINVFKKVMKNFKKDVEGVKDGVELAKSDAKLAKGKAEKAENEAKSAKGKAEKAENEAKLANEKAEKVGKRVEEETAKCGSTLYVAYGPVLPMPSPCYYLSHSNPNSCYYL